LGDEGPVSRPLTEEELADHRMLNPTEKLCEQVKIMLKQLAVDQEEITIAIDWFLKYLISDFRVIGLSPLDKNRFNWVAIRGFKLPHSCIADLALRLEPCTCSEASCERTISAQRLILTSRRLNSKNRLLQARLTLKAILHGPN
jgi:hypothetical protein